MDECACVYLYTHAHAHTYRFTNLIFLMGTWLRAVRKFLTGWPHANSSHIATICYVALGTSSEKIKSFADLSMCSGLSWVLSLIWIKVLLLKPLPVLQSPLDNLQLLNSGNQCSPPCQISAACITQLSGANTWSVQSNEIHLWTI